MQPVSSVAASMGGADGASDIVYDKKIPVIMNVHDQVSEVGCVAKILGAQKQMH